MTFTRSYQSQRHGPHGDEPARSVPDRCSGSLHQHRNGVHCVPIAGMSRLGVTVVWTSLVDTPFQIAPDLPAQ